MDVAAITCNADEITEASKKIMRIGRTPMIYGPPGVGKSDITKQLSEAAGVKLIDLRLSQVEPIDLNGFPTMNLEKMKGVYAPMDTFPLEGEPVPAGKKGWLLFLDEITSAPLSVQAASYKLILDKAVGNHKLHPKVFIAAAGNRLSDKAIVNRMGTAMQSRLIHLEFKVDVDKWLKWAFNNDIDKRVSSFISYRPALLHKFDPNHSDYTFPCPRTWEFASDAIKGQEELNSLDYKILAGTVTRGPAREFYDYTQIFKDLPTLSEIQNNPTGTHVPQEPGVLYALTGMLGEAMNINNARNIAEFVFRLPIEYQILVMQQALVKDEDIFLNIETIRNWAAINGQDFF